MARFPFFRRKKKPKIRRGSDYNRRRRGILAIVVPWLRRFGIVLAVFVFVAWVGAWLWMSGSVQRAADSTKFAMINKASDMGFAVENLLVEGRVNAPAEAVLALMNVRTGDPIFAFDPAQAKDLLEQMNWVRSARVERRLPDTVYVGLQERMPLALWQKDGQVKLLDEVGSVIDIDNIADFADLVIVTGEGAAENAPMLINLLNAVPEIGQAVKSANRVGDRRWDIRLQNDVIVKLPEIDAAMALRRLADAQAKDGLLERSIVAVDLREPEKLVIRTRPGAVQEYQEYKAGFSTDRHDTNI